MNPDSGDGFTGGFHSVCLYPILWSKYSPGIDGHINFFYTGNPSIGTLTNNEDPDEMLHNAAFHQGLCCL